MWPWSRIKALEAQHELDIKIMQSQGNSIYILSNRLAKNEAQALSVARLIGKLEPLFGIPEDSPERRAASDQLGQDIINRLKAEHKAANHSTGGL